MGEQARELLARIRGSGAVLLTGPEGPDGDSIGACLALQRVLAGAAPEVRVSVAGTPPHRYAWLPGADGMVADAAVGTYDGVVVLDGDRRRLPKPVEAAFNGARWTGIIDHHRSTDPEGYGVALLAPAAESTCGMVRELAREWGVPLDRDTAALLYVGLIFDTGGFRYSNTSPGTHALAAELLGCGIDHAGITLKILAERRPEAMRLLARMLGSATFSHGGRALSSSCTRALLEELGANEGDLEGIIDHLQHVEGVDLAAVFVERGPSRVKMSFRSSGKVDVAALARSLDPNGGGHAKAAGVLLAVPLEEARERVGAAMGRALG